MPSTVTPSTDKGSRTTKISAAALLDELRASQSAVAGDVAILQANVVSLGEIETTLATTLEEAKKTLAAIAAERAAAVNAVQVAREAALAAIRAVSKYPVASADDSSFTASDRIGGPHPPQF